MASFCKTGIAKHVSIFIGGTGKSVKMEATRPNTAPLAGIRVLEFAGLGPAPYGGMLLADACCGRLAFDLAFQREIARVLPEQ